MVWLERQKNKKFESKLIKKYKNLSPQFIFLYPTLNFRNNEIGATMGINQLKSLNQNNLKRTRNFKIFYKILMKKNIGKITMLKEAATMLFQLY